MVHWNGYTRYWDGTHFRAVLSDGKPLNWYTSVSFESSDCSGTPYADLGQVAEEADPWNTSVWIVDAATNDYVQYELGQPINATFNSRRGVEGGGCEAINQQSSGRPLTSTGRSWVQPTLPLTIEFEG